jgi:hypothetical protein
LFYHLNRMMMLFRVITRNCLNLVLLTFWMLAATHIPARADSPDIDPPDGFIRVDNERTVELYRKKYAGGSPDYVQVVYLDRGARLELLSGRITEDREGKGAYGGADARILSQTLQKYWNEAREQFGGAFCVTNGTFFYMKESPTRLPFPLKIDGEVISDGYAKSEFQDEKLMLELWSDRADIAELSKEALYTSSAPDILGGLHEDAEKASKKYVARTFVGVRDGDQDGRYETVLVFNTSSARTSDAGKALKRFGADKVMMLDGGGSTQLICKGKAVISSDRLIPQALAVLYGSKQDRTSNSIHASAESMPETLPIEEPAVEMAASVDIASEDPQAGARQSAPGEATSEDIEVNSEPQLLAASAAGDLKGKVKLGDITWVPASMFPVAVLLMLAIARRRGA